jgi:hypothetical protein
MAPEIVEATATTHLYLHTPKPASMIVVAEGVPA